MTKEPNDVLTLVVDGIVAATNDLHGMGLDDMVWTATVLKAVADRGRLHKYYVSGSGVGHHGEWLFDQTWYECPVFGSGCDLTYAPHRLEHLALALESEWADTDPDRLDDFLKLAVSVAETRVMIFQTTDIRTAIEACGTMMDAARRVRTGTDADYLFAAYVRDVANSLERKNMIATTATFPFRFWRTRLHGPLVAVPPA